MNDVPRLSGKERAILELLAEHTEMYGLAMVHASQGMLKRGTIYVTLGRMEDKGYVQSEERADASGRKGPPRRVYRVTQLGERVLHAWHAMRTALVWNVAR